jgi:hypothetical protein
MQYNYLNGVNHKPRKIQIARMDTLPTAMQNGLWSDQRYGPHKIQTLYNYTTRNSTLFQSVLK